MTSQAARRFARAITDQQDKPFAAGEWVFTTVSTVTPGASLDGLAAATVAINADNVPAPYNANYTPTVGDHVAVLLVNGSPLIVCRVAGFPNI